MRRTVVDGAGVPVDADFGGGAKVVLVTAGLSDHLGRQFGGGGDGAVRRGDVRRISVCIPPGTMSAKALQRKGK